MGCTNLKQHLETIEILYMLNEKISIDKLKKMYIKNDIYKLLNSFDEILSNNIYFFALTEDNVKELYLLFEYFRFDYEKRNNELFFKCNSLIKKLNYRVYEFNNIITNIQQRKIDKDEIIDTCFKENLENHKYSRVSFEVIKNIWRSEYFIIKYLIGEPMDENCKTYLKNSAFIEYGIIHLLVNYFDIFNYQEKDLLLNLLIKRWFCYNSIHQYDVYNIYSNQKQFEDVILNIAKYINKRNKQLILKKDK